MRGNASLTRNSCSVWQTNSDSNDWRDVVEVKLAEIVIGALGNSTSGGSSQQERVRKGENALLPDPEFEGGGRE